MIAEKPLSEACERNSAPILGVLRQVFAGCTRVLEIGSGTGQHAVYMGAQLPHLQWQTSDMPQHHAGIAAWLAEARLPNVLPPLALDVSAHWPAQRYDAIFSANTLHIMSWSNVECLFAGIGRVLEIGGVLAVYGPFNYGNARFDAWLRARDAASAIRGFENVDALARSYGLALERDVEMPANNRTLVWRRLSAGPG
jgi:trans-aconitate methyltransferase